MTPFSFITRLFRPLYWDVSFFEKNVRKFSGKFCLVDTVKSTVGGLFFLHVAEKFIWRLENKKPDSILENNSEPTPYLSPGYQHSSKLLPGFTVIISSVVNPTDSFLLRRRRQAY